MNQKKSAYSILQRKHYGFTLLFLCMCLLTQAQSIDEWYAHAQERIDTLRKGAFGIQVLDKNDQPVTGDISVRMAKHEYPFGIAFDLYEGTENYGNTYTTSSTVSADEDGEIYQSERWNSFIAYAIPVEKDSNYNLTLKFAEIYYDNPDSRLFDVFVDGTKYLSDFDIYAASGGQNIAYDTTLAISASDSVIRIEMVASVDNAAIKGIAIETAEGDSITRINCGGGALTTGDGNAYLSDEDFFDEHASRYPSEEQWMKAAMQKYFNYGVSGNSFKWSGIQPEHTEPDYTAFENAVNWTQSIGWDLRAHTLLWGGADYESDHELPRWVKDLPTPQAITDTCKMRVIREVSRYKGIVKEYDVMNEPLHAIYLQSVVGDSINWNSFKWARSADPDAELFVNEYNVEYSWGDAEEYRDLILEMKAQGAPVTGVGMQAHFWEGLRPNVTELVTQVNIVAEAGLPIKFTEFDYDGGLSQEAQANDLVKVMTVAFSHPSINGFICWALSDEGAWRENSGLFTANHEPKLAADSLYYYTHDRWATNFDTTTASGDPVMFNAYYGDYTIEVNFGDTIKTFTIPCTQANEDSVFVLHENEATIKGPVLQSAELVNDSALVLHFDKQIAAGSIINGDFKFFSDNPMRIQDIDVDETDSTTVKVTLQGLVTPDDYLSVSYFPGSLAASDGSKSLAFGPEPVENLTTGLLSAEVTNDGQTIEALFNTAVQNLTENQASFTLANNGEALVIDNLDYKDNDSSMAIFQLATPLTSSSNPTIQYTQGTLQPASGFLCQSSDEIAVSNVWPVLLGAEVSEDGNTILTEFDVLLQNVLDNQDAFAVSVDDQSYDISSISASGDDSTQITFNMATTITAGQEVTLSYQPGSIQGDNGNSLEPIEDVTVTNNSTAVLGIDSYTAGGPAIYPNPARDNIQIAWDAGFKSLVVYNTKGEKMLQKHFAVPVKAIALPLDIESGIYLLKLTSEKETAETKFIINK